MDIRPFEDDDAEWIELDAYRSNVVPPAYSTFTEYRDVIAAAINDAQALIDLREDLTIIIGEATPSWTKARLETEEGRQTGPFIGYSFPEGHYEWVDTNVLLLGAAQVVDNWEDGLKSITVHELAHQTYFQQSDRDGDSQLYNLFFEGHAMTTSKLACERFDYEYASPYRPEEPIELDIEAFLEELDKRRVLSDEQGEDIGELFRSGEPWAGLEGYKMAYLIGYWLVNKREPTLEIGDLPTLPDDQLKPLVIESIEAMYDVDVDF